MFKQKLDNNFYIGSSISYAFRAIGHRDQFSGDSPSPFHLNQKNKLDNLFPRAYNKGINWAEIKAQSIIRRINVEESLKIEDGSIRYFALHPERISLNKGIRENSAQWVINTIPNEAVFIVSPKMAKFNPHINIYKFNDGRIQN